MTDQEKMFEKMLNMKIPKEEMYVQCRNVAYKPITNEEWIRTCKMEQLMDFLFKVRFDSQAPWQGTTIWEWLEEIHK